MIKDEADRMDMYRSAAARIEQRSTREPTPERSAPPRERETSGQFAPAERAYGQAGLERDAGYKPLIESRHSEIDSDRTSLRDASNDRAKELQTKPIEVHESGLDENITLRVEQAASRVAEAREADAAQAELDGTKAAQKAVDDLRGEQPAEVRQPAQIEAELEIEKVLKHPKISAALAERVGAAETQRAEYELGLQNAWKAQLGAIGGDFPELVNLPHTQWAAAINAMAQRDLPRARQIAARLHSLAAVEAAHIQLNAQKEAATKVEMAKYGARENERFKQLTKGMTPQQMSAVQAEVPAMMAEYGVSNPRAFLEAIQGQTQFPRASAERIMIDAAKYRLLQKAPKAIAARGPLPPVARPGAGAPRTNPASANLQSLNAALAKGDLKAAGKMIATNRKATRR